MVLDTVPIGSVIAVSILSIVSKAFSRLPPYVPVFFTPYDTLKPKRVG